MGWRTLLELPKAHSRAAKERRVLLGGLCFGALPKRHRGASRNCRSETANHGAGKTGSSREDSECHSADPSASGCQRRAAPDCPALCGAPGPRTAPCVWTAAGETDFFSPSCFGPSRGVRLIAGACFS